MSVERDASGRRSVQIAVEVSGTPDEVWQAIATGPGISSWLVPTRIEERDGQPVALAMDFGLGMESRSTVTSWDPPRKLVRESEGWVPGSPPMAHEWSVEAIGGGRCVVRIVQSLFACTDDWDNQLEAAEYGWPGFLRTLQMYLTHFRGLHATTMKFMSTFAGTEAEAWEALAGGLGVRGLRSGQRWTAPAGAPAISGVVEHLTEHPYDALLRLDEPAQGVAALGAFDCGGQCMVAIGFYLYGDNAAETVDRETPAWEEWMHGRFPAHSADAC